MAELLWKKALRMQMTVEQDFYMVAKYGFIRSIAVLQECLTSFARAAIVTIALLDEYATEVHYADRSSRRVNRRVSGWPKPKEDSPFIFFEIDKTRLPFSLYSTKLVQNTGFPSVD